MELASTWSTLVFLVFILVITDGLSFLQTCSADHGTNYHRTLRTDPSDGGHHHGMPHMDPSVMVFFTLKDLKPGARIPIFFSRKEPSTSPKFLPREEAESIDFSLENLPLLLYYFSLSPHSPQAKAMEDTLTHCTLTKPIKGETKYCATSIEAMLDFAQSILGSGTQFKVLTTKHLTADSHPLLQNYTVLDVPQRVPAPKMVACHVMPYPYGIYYCHSQESENRLFRVPLRGDNGDRVDAMAVCHMDTSQWSKGHASFQVLGIEPGSSHVCHFFPEYNLVMVPQY